MMQITADSTADSIAAPARTARFAWRLLLVPACLLLVSPPHFSPPGLGTVAQPAPAMLSPVPASAGEVPVVEALEVQAIDPTTAADINAQVPVSTAPNPAAKPFRIDSTGDAAKSFNRAADCLTSAIYYEAASEGEIGGRAVAQVVLNRVRHPAFPKTVCDVIFQGSAQVTGCQFSYTCDGSLARTPMAAIWTRSQKIAREALLGKVYAPVGQATHYHTQFVVPKWRMQLDKITVIGAHIFYRWSGWWGTPPAFRGGYVANEPVIAKLALLSPAHAEVAGLPVASTDGVVPQPQAGPLADPGTRPPGVAAVVEPARQLRIVIDKGQSADSLVAIARERCAGAKRCTLNGWTDAGAVPASAKLSAQDRDSMSFSYTKDELTKTEQSLWNCREFRDRDVRRCLKMPLLIDLHARAEPGPAARLSANSNTGIVTSTK